jgi:CelD/BcsL family acetyltransferase involved in cellulose biosynthesis
MTLAAAIPGRTVEAKAWPATSRIAGVSICHDLSQAESIWRDLELQFSTPFQRFDFLATWQREVGERGNLLPFIVIAWDSEHRPLLLLPLTLSHRNGIRTARFMGGKHATFNMGLWQRDFATAATGSDLQALFSGIRDLAIADVLALVQQPLRWRDSANPMALLPNQPSPNDCPLLTMPAGAAPNDIISNSVRQRLKSKERKLARLPGYQYRIASSDLEIQRLLDWFLRVKPLRMAEQKLPNVFADAGVEDFIRTACTTQLGNGSRIIEIHALECEDEVIAIFAGVADGQRFSMMFNTYTMSDNSRHSPGLILMRNIIDHYAGHGYRALDLGVGSDGYKRMFCKSTELVFDTIVALSGRGKAAASAISALNRAKYAVKHNEPLYQMVQRLRAVLYR